MSDITRTRPKAEWESRNPVLPSGVYGFEGETGKVKRGNGSVRWNALPYVEGAVPYVVPQTSSSETTSSSSLIVVNAGTNLSMARPQGAAAVLWKFSAGVNVGAGGANVVNRQPGDLIFVAA